MKKNIKIGKPFIKECNNSEIFGTSVKLCSKVTMENPNTHKIETKECYFEFENKYKKYLCDERSDAFVVGLLTTAMENDMDIEFEAPISERLYYQLMTYYIPIISKHNANYPMNNIKIVGPTDDTIISNNQAVATGCSGGVDSFYTIAKHCSRDIPNGNRLTHIVYSSSGTNDFNKERNKETYKNNIGNIKKIANDCGLATICCYNNLYEFYKIPLEGFNMFYTTVFGSVAFALQKLIGIYYVSSGNPISIFTLDLDNVKGHDSSIFDLFTTQCMNNENLVFYSTGMDNDRIEKQQYIADFVPAQNNLTVCANMPYIPNNKIKYPNCSFCPKCLRTMVQFYAFNKLDNFKNVFDVEKFYKHKAKYIGKMIALNNKHYVAEMKEVAKRNNVKIPFVSYIYCYLWYKPIKFIKQKVKNLLFIRKIYYKFNLDIKLNGFRAPEYEMYKNKFRK